MGNMVERVARAMWAQWQADCAEVLSYEDMDPERRSDFLALAITAIEAMREPTAEMIAAGFGEARLWQHPEDSWPAMIDAALKD